MAEYYHKFLIFFFTVIHNIYRKKGTFTFIFESHKEIEIKTSTKLYADLYKYSALVHMTKCAGQSLIFVTNPFIRKPDFENLLHCINKRSTLKLKVLHKMSFLIDFLELHEKIVKCLMPINGISWRDISYCLPALHRLLLFGYRHTVKTIFDNCYLPLEICDIEIPRQYHIFLTSLRSYNEQYYNY